MGVIVMAAYPVGAQQGPGRERDYPTELATWVEQHQTEEGENRWQEFVEAATSLSASWEFFALSNPRIAKHVSEDAGRKYADPLALLDEPGAGQDFRPEVRIFFETLDKSPLMDRLDDLTRPSRFVALRAVEPLVTTSQPELGKLRLGVKLCVARMRIEAMDGKPDEVLRSLRHALAMASGAEGRGMLIGYLSANASWAALEREVREQLLEGKMGAVECRRVLTILSARPTPDPRVALGGERLFALESIELFFDKAQEELAAAQKAGLAGPSLEGLASRADQIKQAARFFDGADRMLSPDAQAREAGEADVKSVLALGEQREPAYKPLMALLPAVESMARAGRTFAVHHAGTRTMLALEAFRGRTGHYPQTLEQLVPEDLAALPLDPFASGQSLRYERLETEGGTPATGYLLYSVGTDGTDNGGKPHAGNRASALGPATIATGYDYVINAK